MMLEPESIIRLESMIYAGVETLKGVREDWSMIESMLSRVVIFSPTSLLISIGLLNSVISILRTAAAETSADKEYITRIWSRPTFIRSCL